MTSIFPQTNTNKPDRFFGPGLNVVEKRPENSNQDMSKRKHMVDYIGRCAFEGVGQMEANQKAAIQFKYPANTRL